MNVNSFIEITKLENKLETFLEIIEKRKKSVVLFGGGAGSHWAISLLKIKGITPQYIIDRNFAGGRDVRDIESISFENAKKEYIKNSFLILITSPKYEKEMKLELQNDIAMEDIFSFETELYYNYIKDINKYRNYIKENVSDFQCFYNLLEDEFSKKTLVNVLKGRISSEWKYFKEVFIPQQYFAEDIMELCDNEGFIDVGACDGDTLEVIQTLTNGKYEVIYCWEPDAKCFPLLQEKVDQLGMRVELINKGAWHKAETLSFCEDAEHGASKIVTDSEEETSIQLEKIDAVIESKYHITHIKMDIEGAEYNALLGAKNVIQRCKPKLAICVYHKNEDFLEISKLIKEIFPKYKLYLRHHNISGTETVLYAVV